jgi:hypothetical protein
MRVPPCRSMSLNKREILLLRVGLVYRRVREGVERVFREAYLGSWIDRDLPATKDEPSKSATRCEMLDSKT